MEDKFEWNEETVKECVNHIIKDRLPETCWDYAIDMFKQSKQKYTSLKQVVKEYCKKQDNKEWEILSFKTTDNEFYTKDITGYWSRRGAICMFIEEELINRGCPIYSVKKPIEDVTLSVGDNTREGVIESFSLIGGTNMQVIVNKYGNKYQVDFKYLQKAKQKLFTTEDGVEVYDKDFEIIAVYGDYSKRTATANAALQECGSKPFANIAAANEYIAMNKPCLSVSDLKRNFKLAPPFLDSIIQFVKNKKL